MILQALLRPFSHGVPRSTPTAESLIALATNNFLPFGGDAGANVLAQADYAALAARTAGANSAQLNKVWCQASIISAAVVQMISDNTGLDVLDDGTTGTIVANLKTATSGRLINTGCFVCCQ